MTHSSPTHLVEQSLKKAQKVARNLWWTWQPGAQSFFRDLSPRAWEASGHNPLSVVRALEDSIRDNGPSSCNMAPDEMASRVDELADRLDAYLKTSLNRSASRRIIYLSMEYGIHESLTLYSGGLGVLSGDHLKAASDLNLPLTAVGLMYKEGYFQQKIDEAGQQVANYPSTDLNSLPLSPVLDSEGIRKTVLVSIGDRTVHAQIWVAFVGRVSLYLLDTDLIENSDSDRRLTARLYGGDRRMRIEQELLLGMGAVSLMESDPSWTEDVVYHLNEGHCAFSVVERLRRKIEAGKEEEDAWTEIRDTTVFTTHTPVSAGNEAFDPALIQEYLEPLLTSLDISLASFLARGRDHENKDSAPFSMTILALRSSRKANGVAKLHGEISRGMWQGVWPHLAEKDIPISSITNGVHLPTWVGPDIQRLVAESTGIDWNKKHLDAPWDQMEDVESKSIWTAHMAQKERLLQAVRAEIKSHADGGAPWASIALDRLQNDIFTVGFARRFASYKRASLLLEFPDALEGLLLDAPMQILFAGKAHPADSAGQALIAEIVQASRTERFAGRIVFVEGYDMAWGRLLTQGVDLWLNNPIRPREACGTSGMKAAANGVPNCSILDGWWHEGYSPAVGWAIPTEEDGETLKERSQMESKSLIHLLREEIIPLYYDQEGSDFSPRWVEMMKRSMARLAPRFSANRMVDEYHSNLYQG